MVAYSGIQTPIVSQYDSTEFLSSVTHYLPGKNLITCVLLYVSGQLMGIIEKVTLVTLSQGHFDLMTSSAGLTVNVEGFTKSHLQV